ncbi:MAG: hypothetical protein KGI60_02155 [Patescibacteria group bacterium]|nr:hypothetical protein [Patescibacteria group bacterium]
MRILLATVALAGLCCAAFGGEKPGWAIQKEPFVSGGGILPAFIAGHAEMGPGFIFELEKKQDALRNRVDTSSAAQRKIFIPLCRVSFSVRVDPRYKGTWLGVLSVERIGRASGMGGSTTPKGRVVLVKDPFVAKGDVILTIGYPGMRESPGENFWGKREWDLLAAHHESLCPRLVLLKKRQPLM